MIDGHGMESRVVEGDPSAYREMIDRHGPAVLRACRHLLHDAHDAEDAFQATFLILIRRGPAIRDPELMGRWLVGVARRVAAGFRRRVVRQAARERRWAEMWAKPSDHAAEDGRPGPEAGLAVRDEVGLLPGRYREALTLCYFEGLTHEEAARKLNCPVGTVKVRLVRGRRLLRGRLDRRGVALGAAIFLLRPGQDARSDSMQSLAEATARAVSMASQGEHAALEACYPEAFALAREVGARSIFGNRAMAWMLAVALAISATGGVAWARQKMARRDKVEAEASARLLKALTVDCR